MQGSGSGAAASGWRNWAGDQTCLPASFERPAGVEEVAAAVLRAVAGAKPPLSPAR